MTNLVIEIADYAGQIGSHENLSKHLISAEKTAY